MVLMFADSDSGAACFSGPFSFQPLLDYIRWAEGVMDLTFISYLQVVSAGDFEQSPCDSFALASPIGASQDCLLVDWQPERRSPVNLLTNSPTLDDCVVGAAAAPLTDYFIWMDPQIYERLMSFSVDRYQRYPTIGPRRVQADECVGRSPILVSILALMSFVNFFNLLIPINKLFGREPLADMDDAKTHVPALRTITAFFGLFLSENLKTHNSEWVRMELAKIRMVGKMFEQRQNDPASFIRSMLSALHREIVVIRRKCESNKLAETGRNQQRPPLRNQVADLLGIKFKTFGHSHNQQLTDDSCYIFKISPGYKSLGQAIKHLCSLGEDNRPRLRFNYLPPCLMFQIDIFPEQFPNYKNIALTNIPFTLKIDRNCMDEDVPGSETREYLLCAIIHHDGVCLADGQFITTIFDRKAPGWVRFVGGVKCFSISRRSVMQIADFPTCRPYLVFYRSATADNTNHRTRIGETHNV